MAQFTARWEFRDPMLLTVVTRRMVEVVHQCYHA